MTRAGWLGMVLATGLVAQSAGYWLDIPFVRQAKNGCGAAVLSMNLRYWQRQGAVVSDEAADPVRIQTQLYSARLRGIAASAMQHYLDDHGFRTVVFAGRWDDLVEQLAKGRPLIVALRNGRETHYVVVAGVSEQMLEMNDPADRKLRKTARAGFEQKWRAAGNWTLLAVPRSVS